MSASGPRWVKICGITNLDDAELAVRAGASAIGINLVPSSRRYVDASTARAIAQSVRGRIEIVGVFADEPFERLESAREALGLDWIQLHGAEPEELLTRLPGAFKAVGVASREDVERALRLPGERVLLDAKVPGALGGTGTRFDWSWIPSGASRRVIVAGGLTPENVDEAVRRVRPFGVDVASGVEPQGDARHKDPDKVLAFVRAARES